MGEVLGPAVGSGLEVGLGLTGGSDLEVGLGLTGGIEGVGFC